MGDLIDYLCQSPLLNQKQLGTTTLKQILTDFLIIFFLLDDYNEQTFENTEQETKHFNVLNQIINGTLNPSESEDDFEMDPIYMKLYDIKQALGEGPWQEALKKQLASTKQEKTFLSTSQDPRDINISDFIKLGAITAGSEVFFKMIDTALGCPKIEGKYTETPVSLVTV